MAKKKAKKKTKSKKKEGDDAKSPAVPPPPPPPPEEKSPKSADKKAKEKQVSEKTAALLKAFVMPVVQIDLPVPQAAPITVKVQPPEQASPTGAPSLVMLRNYFIQQSEERPDLLPPQAISEIDRAIVFMESATVKAMVVEFPKVQALLRFWRAHIKAAEKQAEKHLRIVEAKLDGFVRQQLSGAGEKITEGRVGALVKEQPVSQTARDNRDRITTLYFQIEALIRSMHTDVLVQSSLWSRENDQRA